MTELTIKTWGRFLDARSDCIDYLDQEGKTDKEISKILSLDGGEHVWRIRTRQRKIESNKPNNQQGE